MNPKIALTISSFLTVGVLLPFAIFSNGSLGTWSLGAAQAGAAAMAWACFRLRKPRSPHQAPRDPSNRGPQILVAVLIFGLLMPLTFASGSPKVAGLIAIEIGAVALAWLMVRGSRTERLE